MPQASRSSACAVVRPCGCVCTSSVGHRAECLLLPSFGEMSIQILCPLLLWALCLLTVELDVFSSCFAYWALIRYMIRANFLHSVGFLVSFEAQKLSISMKSSLFVLLLLELVMLYQRNRCLIPSHRATPLFPSRSFLV